MRDSSAKEIGLLADVHGDKIIQKRLKKEGAVQLPYSNLPVTES